MFNSSSELECKDIIRFFAVQLYFKIYFHVT
jgi:hypothetical protein